MVDSANKLLEEINEVSRQLLSLILALQSEDQLPTQTSDLENSDAQSTNTENKDLTELMEKRQKLITQLFEKKSPEEISAEPELIQSMISLDNELTANAQLCKQVITKQVIEIKKSKKVAKTYQQY